MSGQTLGARILQGALHIRNAGAVAGFNAARSFSSDRQTTDPLRRLIDLVLTNNVTINRYPSAQQSSTYQEIRITSAMTADEAIDATRQLNKETLLQSTLAQSIWQKARDLPREGAPDGPFLEKSLRFYNKNILKFTKEAVDKQTAEKAPDRLLQAIGEHTLATGLARSKGGFSR